VDLPFLFPVDELRLLFQSIPPFFSLPQSDVGGQASFPFFPPIGSVAFPPLDFFLPSCFTSMCVNPPSPFLLPLKEGISLLRVLFSPSLFLKNSPSSFFFFFLSAKRSTRKSSLPPPPKEGFFPRVPSFSPSEVGLLSDSGFFS